MKAGTGVNTTTVRGRMLHVLPLQPVISSTGQQLPVNAVKHRRAISRTTIAVWVLAGEEVVADSEEGDNSPDKAGHFLYLEPVFLIPNIKGSQWLQVTTEIQEENFSVTWVGLHC